MGGKNGVLLKIGRQFTWEPLRINELAGLGNLSDKLAIVTKWRRSESSAENALRRIRSPSHTADLHRTTRGAMSLDRTTLRRSLIHTLCYARNLQRFSNILPDFRANPHRQPVRAHRYLILIFTAAWQCSTTHRNCYIYLCSYN